MKPKPRSAFHIFKVPVAIAPLLIFPFSALARPGECFADLPDDAVALGGQADQAFTSINTLSYCSTSPKPASFTPLLTNGFN
jgi:hypothetical protein